MKMTNLMEMWGIESLTDYGIVKLLYDIINASISPAPGEGLPILPTESVAKSVDNYYYFGWSGDKWSSPLVEKINTVDELHMPGNIAQMFWDVHGDELVRQWKLFQNEYDPLASYDIHEETGYKHEGGGSLTKTGKDTRTKKGKITTTDSAWGINSSSNVNSDRSEVDYGTSGVSDELGYASGNTTTDTANDNLTVHKYGNLGTTSFTKLLKDDIEMWQWDFYTRFFFPAIDSMIALPIY